MPELPEVITIRNDLRKHIQGKKISSVETAENYPLRPSSKHYEQHVINHEVEDVLNVAKLLLIKLSSGKYLAVHLRMTGNLLLDNEDPYIKTSLVFEDDTKLHFSTVRKFGYIEVWDQDKLEEYSARFGKGVIESDLTVEEFANLMKKRKAPIKNALLNQQIVSGVGNIYANDALYLTKIHPTVPANEIDESKLATLFKNLQKVLNEGVKNRGSSIDRYRDLYGEKGSHQNHFYVYGKKGEPCEQCNSTEIAFEKLQGRGTYYCSVCQVN